MVFDQLLATTCCSSDAVVLRGVVYVFFEATCVCGISWLLGDYHGEQVCIGFGVGDLGSSAVELSHFSKGRGSRFL